MRHFPQLSTGAVAQFPFAASRRTRTVVNEAADGTLAVIADSNAERIMWTLHYAGLSDGEAAAVENLFNAVRGRRDTFVFLDPSSNLLRWSEDLTDTVWTCDPMITIGRAEDADWLRGATFGLTNEGQMEQRISQTVAAAGSLHYCFSFYARSASPVEIRAERVTDVGTDAVSCRLVADWQRFVSSGQSAGAADNARFSVWIPAGASVELAGMQVEAQPAASAFKLTYSHAGVYSEARFADDELRIRADGVNNHSVTLRITATVRRA
jgi:hypothetical protein